MASRGFIDIDIVINIVIVSNIAKPYWRSRGWNFFSQKRHNRRVEQIYADNLKVREIERWACPIKDTFRKNATKIAKRIFLKFKGSQLIECRKKHKSVTQSIKK